MNVYIRRAEHVKKRLGLLSGRLFNVCKDFKKMYFGRNFAQWVRTEEFQANRRYPHPLCRPGQQVWLSTRVAQQEAQPKAYRLFYNS